MRISFTLLSILLFGCGPQCRSAETLATSGATLELDNPDCAFSPQLFTPDWQLCRAKGGLRFAPDGSCPFTLELATGESIQGSARFTQKTDGSIYAVYTFTPQRDMQLNALFVGTELPTAVFAGGSWTHDGRIGTLPSHNTGLLVMTGSAKTLTLTSPDNTQCLRFTFDGASDVMIQDDRQWGPDFSVRIGYNGAPRIFKASEPFIVRFTLETLEAQRLTFDTPVILQAGPEWIPLTYEPDILAGSALDFSGLGLTDAPAGKHGRVLSKGPHFEFENKPGCPQRFYGVNLCFSANFLTSADAERLAVRLSRTGYNAVRFHHHDNGLVQDSRDGTTVNPEMLSRLDSLAAACIKNGIYLTTDLYVSRSVPWRSVGIDRDGMIAMNQFKMLVPVHEGAWENLKTFTRQWLTHIIPYTGRRYADEPALAWLSMINEGNFGNYIAEMRDIPEWQQAWATWLADKKLKDPQNFATVPATLPASLYTGGRHTTAFLLFLEETEERMIARMKAFLRDELKCRALVTNRNAWTNHASDQIPRSELYDYVDDHFYVDHPEFIERPWSLPSRCENVNPIKNAAMGAQNVVFNRLLDKPFTITEYNYSGPGRFRGVGGIITGAMGALQDWAGLWRFTFSHNAESLARAHGSAIGYFDMADDPLSLAAERAAICLFLRGDLAPLRRSYAIILPKNDVLRIRDHMPLNHTDWPWLAWYARLGTQIAETISHPTTWSSHYPDAYTISSDQVRAQIASGSATSLPLAGDGAVTLSPTTGAIIIETPKTCGGFTEKGHVETSSLIFDVGDTAATVWASSLDGNPINLSSHLLLTHLTDIQNTGIHYAQQSRKTLLAWGGLPHLVRNGEAKIRLRGLPRKRYHVYALATSGRRMGECPSTRTNDGWIVFTAAVNNNPTTATLLYEIVCDSD